MNLTTQNQENHMQLGRLSSEGQHNSQRTAAIEAEVAQDLSYTDVNEWNDMTQRIPFDNT